MARTLVIACLLIAAPLQAQMAAADAAWDRRSEGSRGARAAAGPVNAAIAAYQREVDRNPGDLQARWKLLRALRFKGAYVAASPAEKKEIYTRAREVGDEAMAVLERAAAVSLRDRQAAAALRKLPGSAEVLVWDATVWGEWALVYGKMAALRHGAAERIRRSATLAMQIDPTAERGGGARVLGRLHHQTPRVPLVTGWASNDEAIRLLRRALTHDRGDRLTKLFLAEALLDSGTRDEAEAVRLLKEAATAPLNREYVVEEADARSQAQALLRRIDGR